MRSGQQGKSGTAESRVEFRPEDPDSDAARWCLDEYYRELDKRFEGGFDPRTAAYAGTAAPTELQVRCFVAWLDGAPAGCGFLQWTNESVGEIKRMWVAPQARGQGIARGFLRVLEQAARDNGLAAVRLDTNRVLTEAHALYRAAGYSGIARYSDNPYAHHWFGKQLQERSQ